MKIEMKSTAVASMNNNIKLDQK